MNNLEHLADVKTSKDQLCQAWQCKAKATHVVGYKKPASFGYFACSDHTQAATGSNHVVKPIGVA